MPSHARCTGQVSRSEVVVQYAVHASHCGCGSHRSVYCLAQVNPLHAAELFQKQLALAHTRVVNSKGGPAICLSEVGR